MSTQECCRKYAGKAQEELGYSPAATSDFREVLDSKDVDVITIATPDHWHAPMAIMGLKAGKHVYVREKPCSHNPREGELLVLAQQKYDKLVQVGNQRRSSVSTIEIIREIRDGRMGRALYRPAPVRRHSQIHGRGKGLVPFPQRSTGILGKVRSPGVDYKGDVRPYNWHWLHMITEQAKPLTTVHTRSICADGALEVGYPERIS